ncbi:MAG: 2TM domain-containing protein [Bacteroidia bacterium]|nr:2TM domain-containing protein [Bacteroidia bacterium]
MDNRDEHLWRIAKKRVKFKRHLATYIVVNGFLWVLWWFTHHNDYEYSRIPWPAWSTLGWGIGIAFSYFGAYHDNGIDDIQKEFERLKNDKNN